MRRYLGHIGQERTAVGHQENRSFALQNRPLRDGNGDRTGRAGKNPFLGGDYIIFRPLKKNTPLVYGNFAALPVLIAFQASKGHFLGQEAYFLPVLLGQEGPIRTGRKTQKHICLNKRNSNTILNLKSYAPKKLKQ